MQILFMYSLNTIKGASLYHMKEDFYFHYYLSEKGIKLGTVCVLISNFNLKIHKLSISKINSILKMHAI